MIRALDAVAARSPVTLDRYMEFLGRSATGPWRWTTGRSVWSGGRTRTKPAGPAIHQDLQRL